MFEITLCGAALFSDDNSEVRKWFEPMVEFVPLSDEADLVKKAKYYLEHYQEREKINIKFLSYEKKYYTKKSTKPLFTFVVGMAFGFGWTPCIGPILGSILALASTEENISKAIILLSFYSLGLAIPFILSGFLIQKFLVFSKNFKKNINKVLKIGGMILLITGILILTNQLQILSYYILNILNCE